MYLIGPDPNSSTERLIASRVSDAYPDADPDAHPRCTSRCIPRYDTARKLMQRGIAAHALFAFCCYSVRPAGDRHGQISASSGSA